MPVSFLNCLEKGGICLQIYLQILLLMWASIKKTQKKVQTFQMCKKRSGIWYSQEFQYLGYEIKRPIISRKSQDGR